MSFREKPRQGREKFAHSASSGYRWAAKTAPSGAEGMSEASL
jgi:hypothetical protein